jgi:hypothetical protein
MKKLERRVAINGVHTDSEQVTNEDLDKQNDIKRKRTTMRRRAGGNV